MSIITIFKRCPKCGKKFPYDPSVGDFGLICKKCGAVLGFDLQDPEEK